MSGRYWVARRLGSYRDRSNSYNMHLFRHMQTHSLKECVQDFVVAPSLHSAL